MNTALLSDREFGNATTTHQAVALQDSIPIDAAEELRLRTWARQNYMPRELRDPTWHPVILDEMRLKDQEGDR